MHAQLIIGTNEVQLETEIKIIAARQNTMVMEFPLLKIADVRNLAKFTKLSRNEPTMIILKNIHNASDEALNAFLKNLEEPQKNISYILTASSVHKVLETVVSRCRIIRLNDQKTRQTDSDIEKFLRGSLTIKFKYIDTIKNRVEAVLFIEKVIIELHDMLTKEKNGQKKIVHELKEAQKTLNALTANGNIRLQLSRFVIAANKD